MLVSLPTGARRCSLGPVTAEIGHRRGQLAASVRNPRTGWC